MLADYLTRQGIAVLRVDDRGVGGSTGDPSTATTDDFTGDALAGVAFLKTRKEIDPRRIGLIGHSEGGMIAPQAASRSEDVAFIVMMAGTGVTGEEILYRQGELIAAAMGTESTEIESGQDSSRQIYKILREEPDRSKAETQVREILAELVAQSPDVSQEAAKGQIEVQLEMILSPWFRYFLTYDPRIALTKVHCPVLAINGEKDLQVDPKQNLPPIEAALKEGGNTNVTIKEFPGLNHLFQHCQTGAPSEYGKIEETFAPEALKLIADWINEQAR